MRKWNETPTDHHLKRSKSQTLKTLDNKIKEKCLPLEFLTVIYLQYKRQKNIKSSNCTLQKFYLKHL